MSGRERVRGWFETGRLVRASAEVLNFVDLIRALARLGGAPDLPAGTGVEELARRIGPADHLVFILIDGMGTALLNELPHDAFLRSHVSGELRTVFPSSTACALTSLATAQWPAAHAVCGWWTYLEKSHLSAVSLPFVERTSKRPLAEFGISPEDLFPVPSIWSRLKHEMLTVLPARISQSVYSTYSSGGTLQAGYADFRNAVSLVYQRVQNARNPSFTYVYMPEIDEIAHRDGARHERVRKLLSMLDAQLSNLSRVLAGRARLVIASDHGLTDVPADRRYVLPADDPLAAHLLCQPTGEPTVPIFHVREGHESVFETEFNQRFGEWFALLRVRELEEERLLGPDALGAAARRRLGSFVGISWEPTVFLIAPAGGSAEHVGVHGGLSGDEMRVPMILA